MIIVKSNREEIFDFNYWLEHNLTLYDIERILNTQSIDKRTTEIQNRISKTSIDRRRKIMVFSKRSRLYSKWK